MSGTIFFGAPGMAGNGGRRFFRRAAAGAII
jgi:hypothetical protein